MDCFPVFPGPQVIRIDCVSVFPGSQVIKMVGFPVNTKTQHFAQLLNPECCLKSLPDVTLMLSFCELLTFCSGSFKISASLETPKQMYIYLFGFLEILNLGRMETVDMDI